MVTNEQILNRWSNAHLLLITMRIELSPCNICHFERRCLRVIVTSKITTFKFCWLIRHRLCNLDVSWDTESLILLFSGNSYHTKIKNYIKYSSYITKFSRRRTIPFCFHWVGSAGWYPTSVNGLFWQRRRIIVAVTDVTWLNISLLTSITIL